MVLRAAYSYVHLQRRPLINLSHLSPKSRTLKFFGVLGFGFRVRETSYVLSLKAYSLMEKVVKSLGW